MNQRDGTVRFTYLETLDGRGGREGTIDLPEIIALQLSAFEGEPPELVPAKLRWRLEGSTVQFGILIHRLADPERQRIAGIASKLAAELKLALLHGRRPRPCAPSSPPPPAGTAPTAGTVPPPGPSRAGEARTRPSP